MDFSWEIFTAAHVLLLLLIMAEANTAADHISSQPYDHARAIAHAVDDAVCELCDLTSAFESPAGSDELDWDLVSAVRHQQSMFKSTRFSACRHIFSVWCLLS